MNTKLQPALLAGVAIGVLSSLPVVNLANLCCCAWVVCGGVLAAYLAQQNSPFPISVGDGALAGLIAGAVGAVVGTVISIPIAMMMGPMQSQWIEQVLQTASDMPPEVRGVFEQMRGGLGAGAAIGVMSIVGLFLSLFFYSIFGTLGGLLGALIFKKNTPPPPPTGGYDQPVFTPPTFTPPPPLPPPPPPPPGQVG